MRIRISALYTPLWVFAINLMTITPGWSAANYYVDSVTGDDNRVTTTPDSPWKTLSKVNNTPLSAGDTVYLKRGSLWRETLLVDNSGSPDNPITITDYGTDNAAPTISCARDVSNALWQGLLPNGSFEINDQLSEPIHEQCHCIENNNPSLCTTQLDPFSGWQNSGSAGNYSLDQDIDIAVTGVSARLGSNSSYASIKSESFSLPSLNLDAIDSGSTTFRERIVDGVLEQQDSETNFPEKIDSISQVHTLSGWFRAVTGSTTHVRLQAIWPINYYHYPDGQWRSGGSNLRSSSLQEQWESFSVSEILAPYREVNGVDAVYGPPDSQGRLTVIIDGRDDIPVSIDGNNYFIVRYSDQGIPDRMYMSNTHVILRLEVRGSSNVQGWFDDIRFQNDAVDYWTARLFDTGRGEILIEDGVRLEEAPLQWAENMRWQTYISTKRQNKLRYVPPSTGETPADHLVEIGQRRVGVKLESQHDIVIENITVAGCDAYVYDGGNCDGAGILLSKGAHHNTVRDVSLMNNDQGIRVQAKGPNDELNTNNLFTGIHVAHSRSQGIALRNYFADSTIQNNVIHDIAMFPGDDVDQDKEPISVGGATGAFCGSTTSCGNLVQGNTVYNAGLPNRTVGVVVYNSPGTQILDNHIYNIGGNGVVLAAGSNNSAIKNNIIHGTGRDPESARGAGINVGTDNVYSLDNVQIHNNTVYDCTNNGNIWGGISLSADLTKPVTNVSVKNNIVQGCSGTYPMAYYVADIDYSTFVSDYNLFWGGPAQGDVNIIFRGPNYTENNTFTQWLTLGDYQSNSFNSSFDQNSLSVDPLLANVDPDPLARDFHLQPSSPAIDTGDPADSYNNESEPNGCRINIGAYGNTTGSAPSLDTDYDTLADLCEANLPDGDPQNLFLPNPQGLNVSNSSTYTYSNPLFAYTDTLHILAWSNIVDHTDTKLSHTYSLRSASGVELAGGNLLNLQDGSYTEQLSLESIGYSGPATVEIALRSGKGRGTVTYQPPPLPISIADMAAVGTIPTITITAPGDGSSHPTGASIYFNGLANDTEDGALTTSIDWVSSINGSIGTGGEVTTTLSDGIHSITATVSDNDGNIATDTITLTVGSSSDCSIYTDKPSCNADAACNWINKEKICTAS